MKAGATLAILLTAGAFFVGLWMLQHSEFGNISSSRIVDHIVKSINRTQNITSDRNYDNALVRIRCFLTKDCYPSRSCSKGAPSKIPRAKKWEEKAMCQAPMEAAAKTSQGCLVYSFGIFDSYEWEEKIADLIGCEVHAFDPTVDHPSKPEKGLYFHKLGLQASGTDQSEFHGAEYKHKDTSLLFTLPELMQKLNHTGRRLNVLAMDCEGCEWGILNGFCQGGGDTIDQLVLELHFLQNLGVRTAEDVLMVSNAMECLQKLRFVHRRRSHAHAHRSLFSLQVQLHR